MIFKFWKVLQIVNLISISSLNSQKLNETKKNQIKDKGLNEIKLLNFDIFDLMCYNTLKRKKKTKILIKIVVELIVG